MARTDEVGPAKPLEARSPVGVPGRLAQVFGTLRNDALTEPQLAIYMLHSIVATVRCVLPAFDVEATLLNGVPVARELQRRPLLSRARHDPHSLWLTKRATLGLTEAPRHSRLRVRQDLLDARWYELPYLPCTGLLVDPR